MGNRRDPTFPTEDMKPTALPTRSSVLGISTGTMRTNVRIPVTQKPTEKIAKESSTPDEREIMGVVNPPAIPRVTKSVLFERTLSDASPMDKLETRNPRGNAEARTPTVSSW